MKGSRGNRGSRGSREWHREKHRQAKWIEQVQRLSGASPAQAQEQEIENIYVTKLAPCRKRGETVDISGPRFIRTLFRGREYLEYECWTCDHIYRRPCLDAENVDRESSFGRRLMEKLNQWFGGGED